jgi:hypothetical protein
MADLERRPHKVAAIVGLRLPGGRGPTRHCLQPFVPYRPAAPVLPGHLVDSSRLSSCARAERGVDCCRVGPSPAAPRAWTRVCNLAEIGREHYSQPGLKKGVALKRGAM